MRISDGKVLLVFNTPSSLMSGLGNADVHAALALDAKMMTLGETITGASA